jgi:hypothetical protein
VQAVLAWEHSAPVLLAAYDRLWPAPDGGRVVDLDPSARTGPSPPAQPRGNGARRPGDGGAGATGDRGIRDRSRP